MLGSVCKVRAVVANAAAVMNIVQELADEAFVGVVDEFALKLERSYWGDQLVLVKGRGGSPSPHGCRCCTWCRDGGNGRSGAGSCPY